MERRKTNPCGWVIYNIQYDYSRFREWWYGKLYYDYLESDETYGHLAEEFSDLPPEEMKYPYDWEPVTPRGSDYFHEEGVFPVRPRILEYNVRLCTGFYIQKDITNPYKKNLNLIDVHPLSERSRARAAEEEEERKNWKRRDPHQEREKRIQFLSDLSRYIKVRIPLDPRFID